MLQKCGNLVLDQQRILIRFWKHLLKKPAIHNQ
jgi:hypothetical protein